MKVLLGLFIVGVIAAFLVFKYVYNKQHPDYENVTPAFTLKTQDLYQSFTGNKAAASKQYTGQVIAVTGKLSKIETVDTLVTAVFVFKQGMFGDEGIRCTMLKKFNDAAKTLKPDGDVKIKGYCAGFNDTDIIFEKCSIVNQ
ncbi:MAG: hypothetical protein WCK34_15305 [Bacteroidota bacterium]